MNLLTIVIPAICYGIAAINHYKNKDLPMGLVYFSYALANIGFIWYEITKKSHG